MEEVIDESNDIFWWTIFIIMILIVVALIMFFTLRKGVLFQPTKDVIWKPTDKYDDLYLVIKDPQYKSYTFKEIQRLRSSKIITFENIPYVNVWYLNNFPGKQVVLYYHGNNDNISYRQYAVDICNRLKLNLLLLDYRGYGRSSGVPDTRLMLEDAKTAYKFLRTNFEPKDIIIWGESLGGIASIYIAGKYQCDKLVLLSTFYDLNTVIDKMKLPEGAKLIVKRLSRDKFIKNKSWIKKVTCPTVVIHSVNDDILPFVNGEKLYEKVGKSTGGVSKHFIRIDGAHSHPVFTSDNIRQLIEAIGLNDDDITSDNNVESIKDIINNIE